MFFCQFNYFHSDQYYIHNCADVGIREFSNSFSSKSRVCLHFLSKTVQHRRLKILANYESEFSSGILFKTSYSENCGHVVTPINILLRLT